jgi:hypothetical protein
MRTALLFGLVNIALVFSFCQQNDAAHGEWTEFTEKDVEDMIRDVRRFKEEHFS